MQITHTEKIPLCYASTCGRNIFKDTIVLVEYETKGWHAECTRAVTMREKPAKTASDDVLQSRRNADEIESFAIKLELEKRDINTSSHRALCHHSVSASRIRHCRTVSIARVTGQRRPRRHTYM